MQFPLSTLQRSLCVRGRLGREKKKGAHGTMGREKRRRETAIFSVFPSSTACLLCFNLTLFSFRFVNNIPTGKKNVRQLLKFGLILGYAVSVTETAFLFLWDLMNHCSTDVKYSLSVLTTNQQTTRHSNLAMPGYTKKKTGKSFY